MSKSMSQCVCILLASNTHNMLLPLQLEVVGNSSGTGISFNGDFRQRQHVLQSVQRCLSRLSLREEKGGGSCLDINNQIVEGWELHY